ncbi:zona occludens toxin [Pseudomonas sp. PvP027]|uniref:zonular occludens toxin domain-containing protein n=1 Tax=Pseudomonas sp. PvP027 TaxID=2806587 RepID=UPI001AE23226|nr:zonular occludens toxin domain-containing protein [Pseudomonas sp. PvP027]MBP1143236.1 zona occludens toxin [Pseudomonas sp. PvP027]MBP1143258.1 zona occludens toxin [Pseudomonas sp. PvP027]
MIFGSEGLPRSGKSLESMQHIVDSLIKGRTVITNIHGINKAAISEYCVIPLPTVERLLITLEHPFEDGEEEKVVPWVKEQFLKHVVTDSLWIWDEINQFWPPDRQPLAADWAKFVTEHGHFGIDILIMGQDLTELHTTWRKRLQRYTRYTKLDMMGKEDMFHWASYSNAGRNRFKRTAEGKKPYKKEFFPLYKSHRDETQNKDNYKDSRYGVFQTKHKVYGFIFCCLLAYSMYYVWGFFHKSDVAQKSTPIVPVSGQVPKTPVLPASEVSKVTHDVVSTSLSTDATKEPKEEPLDYFDKFASKYDLRLAAVLERTPYEGDVRPWLEFKIDALDASYRIKESFNRAAVASLGWTIERTEYGIKLSKQGVVYVVRSWPLDNFGKVPRQTISDLKPMREASQLAEPSRASVSTSTSPASTGQRFTVVEDSSRAGRDASK